MKFRGAIFDMDGTLIDSMHVWANLGNEYLLNKGLIPEEGLLDKLKTMSMYQAAQYLIDEYMLSCSVEELVKDLTDMIVGHYKYTIPLKPFVVPFLDELKRNRVRMCVATANDPGLSAIALKRLGILDYFEGIITPKETGMGKDNPEFFLKALELINTKTDETMVFEDSLHAIKSAKESGFYVVGVYDTMAAEDWEDIKEVSDRYLYSFDQWKEND